MTEPVRRKYYDGMLKTYRAKRRREAERALRGRSDNEPPPRAAGGWGAIGTIDMSRGERATHGRPKR